MKTLKKVSLFAIFAAILLLVAACANDENGNDNGDNRDNGNSEVRRETENLHPHTLTQKIAENTTVATIDGIEIGAADMFYRISEAEFNVLMAAGAFDVAGFEDEILEEAARLAAAYILIVRHAESLGYYISDEDAALIEEDILAMAEWHGPEFDAMLATDGIISRTHLTHVMHTFAMIDFALEAIIADDALFAPFYSYLPEEADEEILAAKHILIRTEDFDTDEEAMEFAQSLRARIVAGEDFGDLMETYSGDTHEGVLNAPEGYTFVVGMMDPAFEDAVRNEEIGGMSEPFFGMHGIHFVLRIEPDMDNLLRPWWEPPPPSFEQRQVQAVLDAFESRVRAADVVFLDALYQIPVQ